MNPFYEVMQKHPDSKLLEIVEKKRNDYQPEALAAAEQVLTERNISWTIPEVKQAKETDVKKIRSEIQQRIESGQNINMIKESLKEKGVNPLDFAEMDQNEAEKSDPNLAKKRTRIGAAALSIVAIVYFGLKGMNYAMNQSGTMLAISIVIFFGALIFAVYQLLRK